MKLMVLFMALLAVGMVSATDSLCPAGEVLDQQDITGTMSFSLVKNSGGGKPVQECVVGAVEPLLLRPHVGVIVFVEDVVKTLLPPTEYRPFFKTF